MDKRERILESKKFHLTGKIYIKANFELKSPLLIGSGESEHSDIDIIRDEPYGGEPQPMIPATSIVGVFRHLFDRLFIKGQVIKTAKPPKEIDVGDALCEFFGVTDDVSDETLKWLWFNTKKKDGWDLNQSALLMSDILLDEKEFPITQRDSVRIDPRTGTAAEHAKFDYEIVEPPQDAEKMPITMTFEINLRHQLKPAYGDMFKTFIGYFLREIDEGHIRFGAKTNKGFGQLKLLPGTIEMVELCLNDPKKPDDVKRWLTNTVPLPYSNKVEPDQMDSKKLEAADLINGTTLDLNTKMFTIDADFKIKNSMLVRSYSTNPSAPDVSHIERNGKFVLPGTSIMGAVRHRAWKIINTMFKSEDNKKEKFHNLFGYVYVTPSDKIPEDEANYPPLTNKQKERKLAKGRVQIDETIIDDGKLSIIDQVQTRIKIDRFTGGTIAGALLQEKALWQKDNKSVIHIKMQINDYKPWEPALFMFILKDLVTGDLPIGGEKSIGRGVLIGNEATISWTDEKAHEVKLTFEDGFVAAEDQGKLELFSKFLTEWNNVLNKTQKVEGDKDE